MEASKLFYKVNSTRLETKSELKGVYFTKPRLVACYDINYDIIKPADKILYFKMPSKQNYPMDLNIGYDTYIKRKQSLISNALQCTLKYAMSPKAQISTDNVDKIKVFARRGTLVELMICYYTKRYRKCCPIRVSRYNGDLYMVHLDEDSSELETIEPKHTHHEQFLRNIFTDSLKNNPKIDEPIDENKRILGVHQSNFGKFVMIYHGELQGIQSKTEIKNIDDLDTLNACRFVMAKQMWYTTKKNDPKMFRYWLQAYLANISDLYFGYKNNNGIIERPICHKQPSQLPKDNNWKPGICTEFLYEFLQRVNELMENDNINSLTTVYEFYFDSEFGTFTYKVFKENAEMVFITQEYIDHSKGL